MSDVKTKMPVERLVELLSVMPSDPLRQAASTITTLQREVESLRVEVDARIDACTRTFLKNKEAHAALKKAKVALERWSEAPSEEANNQAFDALDAIKECGVE